MLSLYLDGANKKGKGFDMRTYMPFQKNRKYTVTIAPLTTFSGNTHTTHPPSFPSLLWELLHDFDIFSK